MLTTPKVSIIIPAYNEESILVSQLDILLRGVRSVLTEFEVLVVENGSKDRTRLLLKEYSRSAPEIKPVCLEVPDIGGALREGIIQAKAEIIHICAMDYFDLNFFRDTLKRVVNGPCLILGSRNRRGLDQRPVFRKILTFGLNFVLKVFFGFKGTDTHGLKMFRRDKILPYALACKMRRGQFDTELTLRAQYAGIEIEEVPVLSYEIREKRNTFFEKIFRNIKDLMVMKLNFLKEARDKANKRFLL